MKIKNPEVDKYLNNLKKFRALFSHPHPNPKTFIDKKSVRWKGSKWNYLLNKEPLAMAYPISNMQYLGEYLGYRLKGLKNSKFDKKTWEHLNKVAAMLAELSNITSQESLDGHIGTLNDLLKEAKVLIDSEQDAIPSIVTRGLISLGVAMICIVPVVLATVLGVLYQLWEVATHRDFEPITSNGSLLILISFSLLDSVMTQSISGDWFRPTKSIGQSLSLFSLFLKDGILTKPGESEKNTDEYTYTMFPAFYSHK